MLIARKAAESCGAKLQADPACLPLGAESYFRAPDPLPFARLDEFEEYVVCGEIDLVTRTRLRLKQREGKRLVFVGKSDAPWLRFADAVYPRLCDLPEGKGRLFVYNQERLSASGALSVWKLAALDKVYPRNVMTGSMLPNLGGLIAIDPSFNLPAPADLVLAWGAGLREQDASAFRISIQLYMDDDCKADLLLPGSSYLEIDGTALGNNGAVSFFRDPAQGIQICELMKLLYELGWISPATADINHWNTLANELLDSLKSMPVKDFDFRSVDPDKLDDSLPAIKTELQLRMTALHEARKNPVTF